MPTVRLPNEAITQSGATNVQDVLAALPPFGQAISRTSSNLFANGNALATLNLRNLGSVRTLVLVDGRRMPGNLGSSVVDVNMVPVDLVDRIEIVTGGASAVYGSDAIAGAVNFVLKDRFAGLHIATQASLSSRGDAPRRHLSLLGGAPFADGRGHVVVNLGYDDDAGLPSRNRDFAAHDNPALSSYAAQGLFSVARDGGFSPANGATFTFAPDNRLKYYEGANIDGYDRNPRRLIALPIARYSASLLASHALSDAARLRVSVLYGHSRSRSALEAVALGNSGPSVLLNYDGSAYAGIPLSSPYVPQAIRDAAIAKGVDVVHFRRRSVDIVANGRDNRRDTLRTVVALDADIGAAWRLDAAYLHGQSREHSRGEAIYLPNYGASLDNRADGAGGVTCADEAARAAGCVPVNIFGYNTVTAAGAAWLRTYGGPTRTLDLADGPAVLVAGARADHDYRARSVQHSVSASLTGPLFPIGSDEPVRLSAGAEYRREYSSEAYDPFTRAGLSSAGRLSNVTGGFNVWEAFAELTAPLLRDRPGIADLRVDAAVRHGDYSTAGGVWSWQAGMAYAPVPGLRLRAAFARATRAPSVRELYTAPSRSFPGIVDPCDQGDGRGDGELGKHGGSPLAATCASIAAVAATRADAGEFVYSTARLQAIDGAVGGNPALRPESADSLTGSATFTPRAVPGLSLGIDLYSIKVRDAVGTMGQQFSVSQCVATGGAIPCANVTRDAQGFIVQVDAISRNTVQRLVRGIDLSLRQNVALPELGDGGALALDLLWTHLLAQRQTSYAGGPVQNELRQAGCLACGRMGTGFVDRLNGRATLRARRVALSYGFNLLGAIYDNLDGSVKPARIRPYLYHNVSAEVRAGDRRQIVLRAGMNNLTDEQPPRLADGNPAQWPGTGTVADSYDVYGRMLFLAVGVDL